MDISLYFFILKLIGYVNLINAYKDVLIEDQGIVRGYKVDADNVYSFYGIPYATPPSGEDRFKAPLAPKSWDGIFEATEKFIACPQFNSGIDQNVIKEDCLIANIFVPETYETNLPVLIYIHGGSFQIGYASIISGIGLAAKGVISVHINYRLGVNGFLCLGTESAPGNAGAKDMVAAIKWVKKNIVQFGGDPDNITVGGSSAGSIAVEMLILSPMSTGLFPKASLESGTGVLPQAVTRNPIASAEQFARDRGLSNITLDSLEKFFRGLTIEDLKLGYRQQFLPCVETHNVTDEEKFLAERPMETLKNNNYDKVKLLTGFTQFEGLSTQLLYNASLIESNVTNYILQNLFYAIEDSKKGEAAKRLSDLYFSTGISFEGYTDFQTDNLFTFPQYAASLLHARNGADVFLYYFTYNSSVNLPSNINPAIIGPGHTAQSLYIFDSINATIYSEMNEQDEVIREELRYIYVDFMTNGHPMSLLPSFWGQLTVEIPIYLLMDTYFVLSEYPIEDRLQVWQDTFGLEFE